MTVDLSKPLSHRELNDLANFLDRSAGVCGFAFTEGLLTAIATAPETIPPSLWLAEVFPDPRWESMEACEAVVQPLMRLYNSITDALRSGELLLCTAFEEDEEFIDWCSGYLLVAERDAAWSEELVPDAPSLEPWYAVVGEVPAIDALSRPLDRFRAEIPQRALEMYAFWSDWRLNPSLAGGRIPAVSIRVGRNEPCPCGSGRKFKRCCGE
jgi:uncharacterized protein